VRSILDLALTLFPYFVHFLQLFVALKLCRGENKSWLIRATGARPLRLFAELEQVFLHGVDALDACFTGWALQINLANERAALRDVGLLVAVEDRLFTLVTVELQLVNQFLLQRTQRHRCQVSAFAVGT
jgi:hypothetical protein